MTNKKKKIDKWNKETSENSVRDYSFDTVSGEKIDLCYFPENIDEQSAFNTLRSLETVKQVYRSEDLLEGATSFVKKKNGMIKVQGPQPLPLLVLVLLHTNYLIIVSNHLSQ